VRKRASAPRIPIFGEWLLLQQTNTDPLRSEAARHIVGRWSVFPWYSHDRVLRMLGRENSEYLLGAQLLASDFAELFNVDPKSARDSGAAILPFAPQSDLCREIKPNGRLCGREAVPGAGVCGRHGGQWLTEKERTQITSQVKDRVLEATDAAVRVLLELMDNGVSEKVRLDAALAVLDRAGAGATTKIEMEVTNAGIQATEEIRARLAALAGDLVVEEIVVEPEPDPGADGTIP
jgi:hypothetical protein